MKPAGYLCNIDTLGRIVIPVALRKMLDLDKGDCLELFTEDDRIVMKKYMSSCVFCRSNDGLTEFEGKCVCNDCLNKLRG